MYNNGERDSLVEALVPGLLEAAVQPRVVPAPGDGVVVIAGGGLRAGAAVGTRQPEPEPGAPGVDVCGCVCTSGLDGDANAV